MRNRTKLGLFILVTVIAIGFIFYSKSYQNKEIPDLKNTDTIFVTDLDNFKNNLTENFNDIAKNIASPVEIAASIKNSKYEFFKSILLDVKLSDYVTSRDKALLLGAIGVDLMYINFYKKSSAMLIPLNQIRRLSNDLYISQFFDFESLKQLASYNPTKESIDSLIFLTTYNLNQIENYLLSKERTEIGVYMVLGAWIEGIHLLTFYAEKYNDEKINERLAEQQFYLKELIKLLNICKKDRHIKKVLNKLHPLKETLYSVEFIFENVGKPWKTIDLNGDEAWYQWQKSIALIDSNKVSDISQQVESFRNIIFNL